MLQKRLPGAVIVVTIHPRTQRGVVAGGRTACRVDNGEEKVHEVIRNDAILLPREWYRYYGYTGVAGECTGVEIDVDARRDGVHGDAGSDGESLDDCGIEWRREISGKVAEVHNKRWRRTGVIDSALLRAICCSVALVFFAAQRAYAVGAHPVRSTVGSKPPGAARRPRRGGQIRRASTCFFVPK